MPALTCDICGGKLKMGKGKIAICESCGMEHSVERVREKVQEIKGTVHVDNAHLIDNFYAMARDAYASGNYPEAERYCNKIIENDSNHSEACMLKGKAVGWQSNLSNFRFKEAATCFASAIKSTVDADHQTELNDEVQEEFKNLTTALVNIRNDRFTKWPDHEESEGFCNDLGEVASAIDMYIRETGQTINRNRVFSNVAFIVRTSISIVVTTKILLTYKLDGSRAAYRSFVDSTDYCIRILEKTADLCDDDDESDIKIFELIVSMHESVLNNNCSDFLMDSWGAYKETPRLSEFEVNRRKTQIASLKNKIARLGGK